MAQPNVQCLVCGEPGGKPCLNLRTGKPLKNFHKDGRVIKVLAVTVQQALKVRNRP